MKRKMAIKGLFGALMIAALTFCLGVGAGLSYVVSGMVAALLFASAFIPKSSHLRGLTGMGVQAEIWENHIEGNLFKNNEFLLDSVDESQYVLGGKVVHIPQAGSKPNVSVNRGSLPATVVQRTDTDITYNLDVYTSDPILIDNAETVELSYDKRQSILMEHQESLNEVIADYILTKWCPSTNIIRTTGVPNNDPTAPTVDGPAHTPGATGNRLKFGLYDLKAVQLKMDKANVPLNNRFGVLDADMYSQLVDDIILSKYRESSLLFDAKEGLITGKIMGFTIHKRSWVNVYDNSLTPVKKAYGAPGAADDNAVGLFWHKNAVGRAKGPTKFFEQADAPQYYGDVYSFLQRMGARIRRTSEENIIAVVQKAG